MNAKKQFAKLEKSIDSNLYGILIILLGVMLLLLVINVGVSFNANAVLDDRADEYLEANKPAKISIVVLECSECSDLAQIIRSVKDRNVEIMEENSYFENSNEANELIVKYNIRKLPSIILTGEIDEKTDIQGFELIDDAKVLREVGAPYLDVSSGEIKGKVEVIEIVDSSCGDCVSLDVLPTALSQASVYISNGEMVEYGSARGKELISKYGIKQVPAILISKEIDYYPEIQQSLIQSGVEEKEGFYVLHSTIPPYKDLSSNQIVGLVDLIMLKDGSCSECYDVEVNKNILESMGIMVKNEKMIDVSSSEGKALISKYNIKSVPIIILSSEADVYASFVNAWTAVGDVANDGWFVMREPELVGKSRDLVSGQII